MSITSFGPRIYVSCSSYLRTKHSVRWMAAMRKSIQGCRQAKPNQRGVGTNLLLHNASIHQDNEPPSVNVADFLVSMPTSYWTRLGGRYA
jgi:hypothetical protein